MPIYALAQQIRVWRNLVCVVTQSDVAIGCQSQTSDKHPHNGQANYRDSESHRHIVARIQIAIGSVDRNSVPVFLIL